MTPSLSPHVKHRLRTQGYECPHDPAFTAVVPWTRFSPAVCCLLGGIGTIMASPIILGAVAPFAALGAVFRVHPFDLIYNHGIRYLTGTDPLPKNGPPRRFACGVATVWLLVTAYMFWIALPLAGYILGGLFVGVSGLVATTHICIPSLVYRTLTRQPVESTV